jgi:hypothetical protein
MTYFAPFGFFISSRAFLISFRTEMFVFAANANDLQRKGRRGQPTAPKLPRRMAAMSTLPTNAFK